MAGHLKEEPHVNEPKTHTITKYSCIDIFTSLLFKYFNNGQVSDEVNFKLRVCIERIHASMLSDVLGVII
jgi:hypothetical protein